MSNDIKDKKKKNKKDKKRSSTSSSISASSSIKSTSSENELHQPKVEEEEEIESMDKKETPTTTASASTSRKRRSSSASSLDDTIKKDKKGKERADGNINDDDDDDNDHDDKFSSNDMSKNENTDDKKKKKSKSKSTSETTTGNENENDTTISKEKPNFFASSDTKKDNANDDDNDGSGTVIDDSLFTSLPLSDKTQLALNKMNFTRMTQIQYKCIPYSLCGKDIVGCAKTGSGKTLAFVIPCIELLYKAQFTSKNGTGVIIISPTRELAMQIYGVVQEIYNYGKHPQTYGLLMGGANRKTEADKLSKGINLIVCTPGRLLDHLQNTKGFIVRNLLTLVMDEADRILEQGFEDDLRTILKLLPKDTRQTMLFSATQTKKIDDLVRVSIDVSKSIVVDIPTETKLATAAGLEQGYVTCPGANRFLLLFTFLKKNKDKKKIMVFFSSCNSVKFHSELLNYIDIPVLDIHGKQKQIKRTTTFFTFCKAKTGILLCTDVAARGLDIPDVDWIIQYDPPDDPKEYIHRVGRTARGATGTGRALLFLLPEEIGFLKYLKNSKVILNEYEFPLNKISNIQNQLQRLIDSNYYLNRTARDAYRSYLLAYTSHSLRDIYNVHNLDLQGIGKAFGFINPPRVDLPIGTKDNTSIIQQKGRKKARYSNGDDDDSKNKRQLSSGHTFSADNPYGKRNDKDKRQFTH